MSERTFEPAKALGRSIASMDRQELCRFVIELCGVVSEEAGESGYRGGIFPGNIGTSESGEPVIGPGALRDWGGEELQYVAPELYWDGDCGPASDVYSLGLLLWYGLSGGKLPLEDESPAAQLSRRKGASGARRRGRAPGGDRAESVQRSRGGPLCRCEGARRDAEELSGRPL